MTEAMTADGGVDDVDDFLFIINPKGGNGQTLKRWRQLAPELEATFKDFKVGQALTTGPAHATTLARDACKKGVLGVIAVGGDGTIHEVVNGFFEEDTAKVVSSRRGKRTALGIVPAGTGSDFIRSFGWKADSRAALARLVRGQRKAIDVGRVTCWDNGKMKSRFFINEADLGLTALVGRGVPPWKWLGGLSYSAATVQAFFSHVNTDLRMKVDGGPWQAVPQNTGTIVANAQYFGGGMKIAPKADPADGQLDVLAMSHFRWYDFLRSSPRLFAGTHIDLKGVTALRVKTLEIEAALEGDKVPGRQPFLVQADGEPLGTLPASFSILPGAIDLLV
ncbi:Sphingosine kinase [Klebsormidium nitens]|uniref:Sphingosine kinase n=1 Tax=Klebsormidium nitens TaxID=105231 RepID=A0A1Y1I8H0_KLENI|nr:Sphingosine kinase [Klebsormidium nitens]|eukprot:GAQ84398.1 Sphingosine kinase [Klebsormidium nitens]